MKLDLRPRCKRCRKIPRSNAEKANFEKYYPGYCSFGCQEWHRLDGVPKGIRTPVTAVKGRRSSTWNQELTRGAVLESCCLGTLNLNGWRPIDTVPAGEHLFWVVPKSAGEGYTDTNGNPILATHAPYIHFGHHGTWSSLSKATHWMPAPVPPLNGDGGI